MNFRGKRVTVLGIARSGKALAKVLSGLGSSVFLSDVKDENQLRDVLNELKGLGVYWETGGHTDKIYEADVMVISPGVPIHSPYVVEAKRRGVPVISEVEVAYLLSEAPIIAVTGTNGKSTTSSLIHALLKESGFNSYLAGNIGIPLVGEVKKVPKEGVIVAEISSFQLEAVDEFHPYVSLLLNITEDHLDRHKSFKDYVKAKANIFKNHTQNDWAVLNKDDEVVYSLSSGIKARKLFFSKEESVKNGVFYQDGKMKGVLNGKEIFSLLWDNIPLQGIHNLENVMAAMCVGLVYKCSVDKMMEAFSKFKPLSYRMEYVTTVGEVKFYNDSKGTNPDAVRASLQSFKEPVVIIAGGTDKGLDFHPLADRIKKFSYGAVLIGESRIKIAKALEDVSFKNYVVIDDMSMNGFRQAIEKAWRMCPSGGVVLLSPSCASFDMFMRAEHRGEMFNKFVWEMKREYEGKKVF